MISPFFTLPPTPHLVFNFFERAFNSDKFPTPVEATEMIKEQKVAFALKQKEFARRNSRSPLVGPD